MAAHQLEGGNHRQDNFSPSYMDEHPRGRVDDELERLLGAGEGEEETIACLKDELKALLEE